MDLRFYFEGRTERLIAVGRMVLASFSLLAIWLDPSEPAQYAEQAYTFLTAYVLYAVVIALLAWLLYSPVHRLRLTTHILDLVLFSAFMYLTGGPTSPFFVYFVFSIVCATLRWQWRGTLWTTAAALAVFLSMGIYGAEILQDPAFELNRFVIRSVYLGVVGALLGYLGAHEFQHRGQLSKLAGWPRTPPFEAQAFVSQVLGQAAAIFNAPRVLMVWEEPEEPWLHLAVVTRGQLQYSRNSPESFTPLVAAPLRDKSFFSNNLYASVAVIAGAASAQVERWHGNPLNPELARQFNITRVLCVRLAGEHFQGRLLFLDMPFPTSDDVILAEVVAHQVAASLDLFHLMRRLQQVAATEERVRLAGDLHDGLLQSLTACGLKLQFILQILKTNPELARKQLLTVQNIIVQEQRDLRSLVGELKLAALVPSEGEIKLERLLKQLGKTVEQQWSLRLELSVDGPQERVPADLRREIYHIVREGLVNAARHSEASVARVDVEIEALQVHLKVSDNGHGFPFRGSYDHARLTAMGVGPAMIKSRVEALGGSLSVDSTDSGSCLEIALPLSRPGE